METPAAKYPRIGLPSGSVSGAGESLGLFAHGASVTEDGNAELRAASPCRHPLFGTRPGWKEGRKANHWGEHTGLALIIASGIPRGQMP